MRARLSFFVTSVLLGLSVAFVIDRVLPNSGASRVPGPAAPASYASAVAAAGPTVVSIFADKVVVERQLGVIGDPTLQRFLGVTPVQPTRQRPQRSLGSAVLVDSNGTMVTNEHVVADADNIRAVLWDGRIALATVIGSDPGTDLAVLKIDLDGLPAARFTDSDQLRVGDVVLAIGNPYGYSQSVTSGIVSAIGRTDRNLRSFESFIQTDAAINDGNSGGALINARGELVGINTATLTRRDLDYAVPGISFAIPANVVRSVLEEILRTGEVTRGWIGAEYLERIGVDPRTNLPTRSVYVQGIYQGAPAALAGVLPGDLLETFAGAPVESPEQLRRLEAHAPPGTRVRLTGRREGVPFTLESEVIKRPKS